AGTRRFRPALSVLAPLEVRRRGGTSLPFRTPLRVRRQGTALLLRRARARALRPAVSFLAPLEVRRRGRTPLQLRRARARPFRPALALRARIRPALAGLQVLDPAPELLFDPFPLLAETVVQLMH